jgi:DNA helicase II / ATP-dependent DNA helicase PcrA
MQLISMNNNKLIIAAAGSGKTTLLVSEALKIKDKKVLITTFTLENEAEIIRKIIEINKCIPQNITVQTWFSFLLKHGARPFQGALFEKRINGLILVNGQSAVKGTLLRNGRKIPIYFSEKNEFEQHYFTRETKIYSDKLSKFVCRCNKKTKGDVIDRISRIFQYIFIDEVQDLIGYDLELIKLLFKSTFKIFLVGDPRQMVYQTHDGRKHPQYFGKIDDFIKQECPKSNCQIVFMNISYRCNQIICNFSNRLFPNLSNTISGNNRTTEHDGIFFVKKQYIDTYLQQYKPIQLRWDNKKIVNKDYSIKNFGESKGLSFPRVLIYPTVSMLEWIKNNQIELEETTRSKLYVAITRAKYSVGIVVDDSEQSVVEGIEYFQGI